MNYRSRGALCALLVAVGASTASADIWVVHDGTLERFDVDGSVVTTVPAPFGTPIGPIVDKGEVDARTGNVWIVSREFEQTEPPRFVRVLGVTPSGEELWERTVIGVGFVAPSIAIDPVRRGVWVVGSESATAVLHDEATGDVRATIRGAAPSGVAAVAPDGALWIDTSDGWLRLEGTVEELDGYEIVGSTGPHHRTVEPDAEAPPVAVDPDDGSLYFVDRLVDESQDVVEAYLVKLSPEGELLFRVRHGPTRGGLQLLWENISDIAVDPLDGGLFVTQGAIPRFNGSVSHVSSLGADLGSVEYREHVNSVTVDPEDSGVWIGHMPRVDDDETFIAPMILRKLDASLETELDVPFESVVTVIGAAPAAAAALEISLDIQPQDKRNVVNLVPKQSQVRVALLSSASFDALQADLDSIRFGTAGAVVRAHRVRDVNRDGRTDLVVTFRTAETGIKCGDVAAPLTAETHDGRAVRGTGSLQTRCKP